MKKQRKVELRAQRREIAKANRLLKKQKVADELESQEPVEDEELLESELEEDQAEVEIPEEDEDESAQKDMGDMPTMASPMEMAMGGPTSFDDLDQQRLETERADALHDLTCDVRDLVNNILSDVDMDLSAKSTAIKQVGTDFSSRSGQILAATTEEDIDAVGDDDSEQEDKDLDLLALEALSAYDNRHSSVWDQLKAKVSYGERKNMPDSNFAVNTTVTGKSGKKIQVRKYLIQDKAHVRNALARIPQAIAVGGDSAKYARMAMPKVHAAAKRMGIEMSTKKERNAILIEKDSSGQWRWVGWVSNNFIDWDTDIISEKAHKEYVEWWEKNQDCSPVFVSWHTPGTARESTVDFMTYEKGFLIMSGPLTEPEAAMLLKARKITDLGMSHGSFVFARDPKDPRIITKYRIYEVSDLPLENAANPFTNFETISKEVGMDKQKYLAALLGSEEKAQKFLEKTGLKQKELQEAGVTSKEQTVETAEVKTVIGTEPVLDPKAIAEKIMKEMDIEGLNAFVLQAQEDHEKVAALEELVKDQQTSKNDELAKMLTPPAQRFAWSKAKRASESEETIVKETDELKNKKPGVPDGYWLSEVSGTAPVSIPE